MVRPCVTVSLQVSFVNFFATIEIMKPRVYILRGAPASGKGTIVPEIAKLKLLLAL